VALLEADRLHEAYDKLALDDEQIEAGIREGRLVLDRRLQRFLAAVRERSGAGAGVGDRPGASAVRREHGGEFAIAAPEESSDGLAARTEALARAVNARGHETVRRGNPEIESLRARAKEGNRAAKRLRQLEGRRWVRAGRRVEAALVRVRGGREEGADH